MEEDQPPIYWDNKECLHAYAEADSFKALTITCDNGKEFTDHKETADKLNTDKFFAHAYVSWERGTSKNTNGVVRQ